MFPTLDSLLHRFIALGAVRVFFKALAENDNSKQQIYLGGSFDALQCFPFEHIETSTGGKQDNYKVKLRFKWVSATGVEQAAGAQLILISPISRGSPIWLFAGLQDGTQCAAAAHSLEPTPGSKARWADFVFRYYGRGRGAGFFGCGEHASFLGL